MERFDIEAAKNAAKNGRWFCAMLFAVALVAFHGGYGERFGVMAVLAALPVGLSILIDAMPEGRAKAIAGLALYLFTAVLALVLLLSIG